MGLSAAGLLGGRRRRHAHIDQALPDLPLLDQSQNTVIDGMESSSSASRPSLSPSGGEFAAHRDSWDRSSCGDAEFVPSVLHALKTLLEIVGVDRRCLVSRERGLGHPVHDGPNGGQVACSAVSLQPHFLAVIGGELADLVQGTGNLLDRFFARNARMELIGKHTHATAADVVAQFHECYGVLDGRLQIFWLGPVHPLAARQSHQLDGAVGEPLSHVTPLLIAERQFDAMRIAGPFAARRHRPQLW